MSEKLSSNSVSFDTNLASSVSDDNSKNDFAVGTDNSEKGNEHIM